ncbi:MAG: universal stress protein [Hydrogenophaga sp.]|uniref:universal stress protein n=1 Tax=Hydrogenophaga sp. TaxID=1904254 RepID=UPI003D0E58CD
MNHPLLLAVTDHSVQAEHAIERAAMLARQQKHHLHLLHFGESTGSPFTDPAARLAQRARQLARRHALRVTASPTSTPTLEGVIAQCGAARLLVMAPQWQRHWKTFYKGSLTDQCLQGSPCPVLLVKHAPAGAYQRALVAVDLSPRSGPLVESARPWVEGSQVELFHAIDTLEESKLRSANVSWETQRVNRMSSRQRARERLIQLTSAFAQDGTALAFDLAHGDAAYQTAVQQQATGAQLVVVGKQHRTPLADFLTGSVAQRVARWAQSDVLVVPLKQAHAQPVGAPGSWAPGRSVP